MIKYSLIRYLGVDTAVLSSDKPPENETAIMIGEAVSASDLLFLFPSLKADIGVIAYKNGKEQTEELPFGALASIGAYLTRLRGLPWRSLSIEAKCGIADYCGISSKGDLFTEKPIKCKQLLSNKLINVYNCDISVDIIESTSPYAVIKADDVSCVDEKTLRAVMAEVGDGVTGTIAVDAKRSYASAKQLLNSDTALCGVIAAAAFYISRETRHFSDNIVTLEGTEYFYSSRYDCVSVFDRPDISVKVLSEAYGYNSFL